MGSKYSARTEGLREGKSCCRAIRWRRMSKTSREEKPEKLSKDAGRERPDARNSSFEGEANGGGKVRCGRERRYSATVESHNGPVGSTGTWTRGVGRAGGSDLVEDAVVYHHSCRCLRKGTARPSIQDIPSERQGWEASLSQTTGGSRPTTRARVVSARCTSSKAGRGREEAAVGGAGAWRDLKCQAGVEEW